MTGRRDRGRRDGEPSLILVGPWVSNKGDDLMLHAVVDRFAGEPIAAPRELWDAGVPDPLLPVWLRPPDGAVRGRIAGGEVLTAARLVAKAAATAMPSGLLRRLTGTGTARRATLLLDCSGFAYGDAWGPDRLHRRHAVYADLRRRGTRIVMLPQALGPFERPEIRAAATRLFSCCDAIFARDADSLAYLRGLDLGAGIHIAQAPDITHALSGQPPADVDAWRRRVALVPNMRMLDRTSPERGRAYVDFMAQAARSARRAGLEPWLALHEANDGQILAAVNAELDAPLTVIDAPSRETKGMFACCHALVASRYHALVSGLSQGVPVIGTSWAHKYDRLFEEYGHAPFLLPPEGDPAVRQARFDELFGEDGRDALAGKLARHAARKRDEVDAMWRWIEARAAA